VKPVVMAEFESPETLLAGARAMMDNEVTGLDAFTPYEVKGLEEVLHVKRSWLGWIVLAGGLAGAGGAYWLQWWINVVDYPLNIGGRPYHSWPAFVPITFEMGVLFASFAALISAIVLGGLPKLWHPVFDIEGFDRATIDRFWIGAGELRAKELLEQAGALRVVVLDGERS
jgi:hypothetical protein